MSPPVKSVVRLVAREGLPFQVDEDGRKELPPRAMELLSEPRRTIKSPNEKKQKTELRS